MTINHTEGFSRGFGFQLASDQVARTKCQRWCVAARKNVLNVILSYIPVINLIALSIIIGQEQKNSRGEYLKSSEGKAFLGRAILASVGFVPLVMFLDVIATMIKGCKKTH